MFRPHLKKLKAYSLEKADYKAKLNQNESPYDLPEDLKEKILEELRKTSWNRYPSPWADPLCKKIAEKEGWDPEGVLASAGSNRLIHFLVQATSLKGRVLTISPSFSLYRAEASLVESKAIKFPLNPDDFSLPLEKFLRVFKRARPDITFLANPNAPTGNLFPQEDLLEIVKLGKRLGRIVVVDEAYYQFAKQTLKGSLKKYPNLVLLRTFSKAFSLGGVRLGILLANPKVVAEVKKVMPPFMINHFQQAVGSVVLESDSFVEEVVQRTLQERGRVRQRLQELPGVYPYPSDTNFILFKLPRSRQVFHHLLSNGILVRPMTFEGLPDCLRVTVGTAAENDLFLNTLAEAV
ncbi:MAG: histidinol-phosphate transaminase [Deltaproteobacteria bacterium]|nr:histidinol-phosphate transaminase [Deltaproteobacteria bacterium]